MFIKLKSMPRQHPKMLMLAASLAIMTPSTYSEEPKVEKEEKEAMKGTFPALDVLPEGSILRRVRLPRYNKDFMPISLLTAETLTVLDKHRIEGKDITVELYDEDGKMDARTKMRHAIYNQKLSTLHANEAIFIEGKQYVANGTGLVLEWKKRQGFLTGPVNTRFNKPISEKPITMTPKPKQAPRAIASSLMVLTSLTTSAMAEPPAKLTEKQLKELDQLSQPAKPPVSKLTPADHKTLDELEKPLAKEIAAQQETTKDSLAENARMNKVASDSMAPFLKKIGQEALLISTAPQEDSEEAKTPDKKTANTKPAEAKPQKPVQTLKVTCDGGLYFDSDTGVLAYLKNIHLVEPRFKLSCTDELKVFLEKKAPKDKASGENKEEPTANNKDTPPEKTKDSAKKDKPKKDDKETDKLKNTMSEFGDVSRIIATGKVKLTRKDDEGNVFIATANTASYNAKTGEMILRGGFPRLQMAANQYLQSKAPGQYIRVLKSGKFIAEGKWEMVTPTNPNKFKP